MNNINMKPTDVRNALRLLGLSQVALARLLNRNPRTVRTWCQKGATDKSVIYLLKFWILCPECFKQFKNYVYTCSKV